MKTIGPVDELPWPGTPRREPQDRGAPPAVPVRAEEPPHAEAASDVIDSRAAHAAALRTLVEEAARAGSAELWMCDRDFADWPLGERAFVAALEAWVDSRRRLTLLAADFGVLALRAPRWHAWRRTWSHAVQCLQVHEELAGRVPSLLFVPGLAALRLYDAERVRGRVHLTHLVVGGAHRSISPITMSMLALIAITSLSRWPSTIFGIAERFTNDGGRMRQRTGFEVPSLTM